jgi:GNAT superfamily N-acetyltransferase
VIRDLTLEDYAQWQALWAEYCVFYKVELPDAITQRTWAMLMDPQSSVHGRVAQQGGKLIGFVHHVIHPTTWTATNACYLEDLFVHPTARGIGVGRALIDDLLAICQAHGWSRLYWHTDTDNTAARSFYDRYVLADPFVRYRIPLA